MYVNWEVHNPHPGEGFLLCVPKNTFFIFKTFPRDLSLFSSKNRPLGKIVDVGENFAAVAFNEKLLGQLLFVLQTPAAENNDELSSLAAPPKKNKEIKRLLC